MIEYIVTTPWYISIVIWILIGLIWSDVLLWFQRQYVPDVNFSKSVKISTTILWPLSMVVFIGGIVYGLIKYFEKK